MQKQKIVNVRKLTQMAILSAISVILVYFIRFPIFPAAPFLEYDPADITLILGAFMYGPAAALIMTAVVSIIQGLTVSAGSSIIGIIMHFAATGSYVLLAGYIYKHNKTLKTSIFAMGAGIAIMCISMILWNIIFTPIFMGVPRKAVLDMILPVILPFNLIKSVANSAVAFLVFKTGGYFLSKQIK